jgi:hypothetical protein
LRAGARSVAHSRRFIHATPAAPGLGGAAAVKAPDQEPALPFENRSDGEDSSRNFDGRGKERIFCSLRSQLE